VPENQQITMLNKPKFPILEGLILPPEPVQPAKPYGKVKRTRPSMKLLNTDWEALDDHQKEQKKKLIIEGLLKSSEASKPKPQRYIDK